MTAGMVIIGGGMAGARAVIGLRANGWQGSIILICSETLLPYDRPPLSKSMLIDQQEPSPVALLDDSIVASLKATVVRGNPAIGIDRKGKLVLLTEGAPIPYAKLLIATGAKPRHLTLPGGELAYTLRDYADGDHLRSRLRNSKTAAIIGGGFIGLEVAASASKLGCSVSLVEAQSRILMRGVPAEIAAVVHSRHERAGIKLEVGTALSALDSEGILLADGRKVKADITIAGIGAAPETSLAQTAGLSIDNGIACDAMLQTSDPDIYAAGDCCSFPHPHYGGRRLRLEAWRNAQDQGSLAAENMLGATKEYRAIPWFWSDQHDLSLQIAGLADEGKHMVRRDVAEDTFLIFYLNDNGRLVAASGIGPGNSIARDIKLAEMLIARNAAPAAAQLADPAVPLKSLLRG